MFKGHPLARSSSRGVGASGWMTSTVTVARQIAAVLRRDLVT